MKNLNLRIIHTHDTEDKWALRTEFIPKAGEIIVYDADSSYAYERFKIGDGVTLLNELPFAVDNAVRNIFNIEQNVLYADAGRI